MTDRPRRVRISRPAFQDMHHLVMPRLTARAQLRRQARKLESWCCGDRLVADLECFQIPDENLVVLELSDGYCLADGFRIVFCEVPAPEPEGTICILSVMRNDGPFSAMMLEILRGRQTIARERLQESVF